LVLIYILSIKLSIKEEKRQKLELETEARSWMPGSRE
jgi:hypothetical protein